MFKSAIVMCAAALAISACAPVTVPAPVGASASSLPTARAQLTAVHLLNGGLMAWVDERNVMTPAQRECMANQITARMTETEARDILSGSRGAAFRTFDRLDGPATDACRAMGILL